MKFWMRLLSAAAVCLNLGLPTAHAADALPATVTFDLDKAAISAAAESTLQGVAQFLKATPAAKVIVSGFTDTSGTAPHNDALAKDRAYAVREVLLKAGITEDRIMMVKPEERMKAGNPEEARSVSLTLLASTAAAAAGEPEAKKAEAPKPPNINKDDTATAGLSVSVGP